MPRSCRWDVRYRKGRYRTVRVSSVSQQNASLASFEPKENHLCDSVGLFPLSFLLAMHYLTIEPPERKACLLLP